MFVDQSRTDRRRAWLAFAFAVAVIIPVQGYSLRFSPTIWQDEVQILDWGRTILPGSDQAYAMSWLQGGQPYSFISYLGCAVQEFACRLSADDPFGPRFSVLLGACLAAAAMLGWLMQRGVAPWIAATCSVILLMSPTFAQSYRGGRVDSWAIAFMLLACWAAVKGRQEARDATKSRWRVAGDEWQEEGGSKARGAGREEGRKSGNAEKLKREVEARVERREGRGEEGGDFDKGNFDILKDSLPATSHSLRGPAWRPLGWFALAGVCAAVAGLMWVSAIVLLPLLAHELLFGASRRKNNGGFAFALAGAVVAAIFACLAALVLFLPVWERLPDMLRDFAEKAPQNGGLAALAVRMPKLLNSFQLSPFVPILGLLSILFLRRWSLLVAFLGSLCFVVVTGPYVHRNVYLVPYFAAGLALGAQAVLSRWRGRNSTLIVAATLAFCLLWSSAVSLGGRTLAAYTGSAERNPGVVLNMAREKIGAGPHKVYVWNWEFGYAARKLGWKFYKWFHWESLRDPEFLALLGKVDHLIVASDNPLAPSPEQMTELGFTKLEKASPPGPRGDAPRPIWQGTARYREYLFYSRPDALSE